MSALRNVPQRGGVALLYIALGDYHRLWPGFRTSAEHRLVSEAQRTFIVFSDQPAARFPGADLVIPQDDLGWPMNTLARFRFFRRIRDQLASIEHVLFLNANVEIHDPISVHELFGADVDLVACRHPGFYDKAPQRFTYERRPESTACVTQGSVYVAGGLMGGRTAPFLEMCDILHANIEADLDRGLLALWHDESHWNHYINERAPALGRTVHLLDPGCLYPEGWRLPFPPRIVLRDKARFIDVKRLKGPPR